MKQKESQRAKGSGKRAVAVDATETGPPRMHRAAVDATEAGPPRLHRAAVDATEAGPSRLSASPARPRALESGRPRHGYSQSIMPAPRPTQPNAVSVGAGNIVITISSSTK